MDVHLHFISFRYDLIKKKNVFRIDNRIFINISGMIYFVLFSKNKAPRTNMQSSPNFHKNTKCVFIFHFR